MTEKPQPAEKSTAQVYQRRTSRGRSSPIYKPDNLDTLLSKHRKRNIAQQTEVNRSCDDDSELVEVYHALGYEPPEKTSDENIPFWLRPTDPQAVLYRKIGYLPPLSPDVSALVEAIQIGRAHV